MQDTSIDQVVSELAKKIWRKRGTWYHTVLFAEIFGDGESTAYVEKLGYPFKKTYFLWLENGDCFDLQEEWDGVKRAIEEECIRDTQYLKTFADHCLREAEDLTEYCDNIKKQNITLLQNEELSQMYRGAIEKMKEFMPFMFTVHLVDEILSERFSAELSRYSEEHALTRDEFFAYQTALTLPYRKILVLEEQDDLLNIAVKLEKENLKADNPTIQTLLSEHTDKYSWINAYLFEKPPYTEKDFLVRLNALLKTDVKRIYTMKIEAEKNLMKQQTECMKNIAEYTEFVGLSQTVQIYGFLRSYRVDIFFYAFFKLFNLIEEISKRLSISVTDIRYLSSEEVAGALLSDTLDYRKLVADRKNGSTSVNNGVERNEFIGTDIERIMIAVTPPTQKTDGIVTGTIAYPGKIIARCRVLFNLDDMHRVEEGDVLVIAMTDPNYIPAMNKASAFVTDQGGILCHAAIVSREMKKPCIIGTKNATRVLKDGDLVEVDAEKGVVKIIKRQ